MHIYIYIYIYIYINLGKTLGGGLPIGVVCGPKDLMARGDVRKAAKIYITVCYIISITLYDIIV